MLASIARNSVSVQRQVTIAGERVISADVGGNTITTLATPVIPATVLIKLTSADSGSALITGTDSTGGAQTETITFSSSKLGQGIKLFATVTSIETTTIAVGNTVQAVYRGVDGSSVKSKQALYACLRCQISYSTQSWPNGKSGTVESGKIKIMIPLLCNSYESRLRPGDLITDSDSGFQFLVSGIGYIDGVGINRFQVVYGERRERT